MCTFPHILTCQKRKLIAFIIYSAPLTPTNLKKIFLLVLVLPNFCLKTVMFGYFFLRHGFFFQQCLLRSTYIPSSSFSTRMGNGGCRTVFVTPASQEFAVNATPQLNISESGLASIGVFYSF